MKEFFTGLLIFITATIVMLLLIWIFQGNDFFMYKYFAPKVEQVRYDTFKNSQAKRDGDINELNSLMLQYQTATKEHKPAIREMALHMAATMNQNDLPPNLRTWINDLTLGVK